MAKIGSEFQVNTYTATDQYLSSIATLSNGNFVVTWASGGQDGSGDGIYGQVFTDAGVKSGSEFQVNTYTASYQSAPSIATLSNGNFVVTWQSNGQDGSGYGVYGQVFTDAGVKSGSEFQVNTYTTSDQSAPSIATLSNGNFVVTWKSYVQDGSESGVYGQVFTDAGVKSGSEFRVNTYTADHQYMPSVTTLSNGNFVVTWTSNGQDGSRYGVYGQVFTNAGVKSGNEFQVNTYTTSEQYLSSIATLSNGNFVVTWSSAGQDGSGFGIYGQVFTNAGVKSGSEFQVSTYTTNAQVYPSIATLSNGNFVVTWHSDGQDASLWGVYGQVLSVDTSTSTTSTSITTSTTSTPTTSTTSTPTTSTTSTSTTPTTSTTITAPTTSTTTIEPITSTIEPITTKHITTTAAAIVNTRHCTHMKFESFILKGLASDVGKNKDDIRIIFEPGLKWREITSLNNLQSREMIGNISKIGLNEDVLFMCKHSFSQVNPRLNLDLMLPYINTITVSVVEVFPGGIPEEVKKQNTLSIRNKDLGVDNGTGIDLPMQLGSDISLTVEKGTDGSICASASATVGAEGSVASASATVGVEGCLGSNNNERVEYGETKTGLYQWNLISYTDSKECVINYVRDNNKCEIIHSRSDVLKDNYNNVGYGGGRNNDNNNNNNDDPNESYIVQPLPQLLILEAAITFGLFDI